MRSAADATIRRPGPTDAGMEKDPLASVIAVPTGVLTRAPAAGPPSGRRTSPTMSVWITNDDGVVAARARCAVGAAPARRRRTKIPWKRPMLVLLARALDPPTRYATDLQEPVVQCPGGPSVRQA